MNIELVTKIFGSDSDFYKNSVGSADFLTNCTGLTDLITPIHPPPPFSMTNVFKIIPYEHNSNLHQIVNQQDWLVPAIRGFKIASLNITSLPKHIDELGICMNDKEIDVLAINETRMDDSVPTQSIAIQGYSWISKNRNRSGGGVGFFIRDSINFRPRTDLNDLEIEMLTIQISKQNVKPFLITTWYRPPNDPIDTLYRFENCPTTMIARKV